jgi:hypothetical protein
LTAARVGDDRNLSEIPHQRASERLTNPRISHEVGAHLKAGEYFGAPKVQALFEATFFADLRKAGMSEE